MFLFAREITENLKIEPSIDLKAMSNDFGRNSNNKDTIETDTIVVIVKDKKNRDFYNKGGNNSKIVHVIARVGISLTTTKHIITQTGTKFF